MLTEDVLLETSLPKELLSHNYGQQEQPGATMVLVPRLERGDTDDSFLSIVPAYYGGSEAFIHAQNVPEVVSYEVLRGWLAACESQHDQTCGLERIKPVSGLWMIECENFSVVRMIASCRYVALSYVWGVTDTIQRRNLHESPRTIRDAMLITRELGLRYLWVDKYCIRSNDTNHMMQQVRQMHYIYEQSYLTIIAAAGANADYGIPGVANFRREKQLHIKIGNVNLLESSVRSWSDLQHSPWRLIGWTLQEGVLFRRRLIFTDRQVHFECLQGHCQESIYDPVRFPHNVVPSTAASSEPRTSLYLYRCFPAGIIGDVNRMSSLQDHVRECILGYAFRQFTCESDVLHAFTGIMHKYEETTDYRFHWGMPYNLTLMDTQREPDLNILLNLLVHMNAVGPQQRRPLFPSWSWAGWRGGFTGLTISMIHDKAIGLL